MLEGVLFVQLWLGVCFWASEGDDAGDEGCEGGDDTEGEECGVAFHVVPVRVKEKGADCDIGSLLCCSLLYL
jgi:hypothetical protein